MAGDEPLRRANASAPSERRKRPRRTDEALTATADSVAQGVGPAPVVPHPRAAMLFGALGTASAIAISYTSGESLLAKNWLSSTMATTALLASAFWAIPKFTPKWNAYLWTEARARVHVRHSIAVALVAFFLAFVAIAILLIVGYFRHHGMTAHWNLLWGLVACAAALPTSIAIFIGLQQIGATRRFEWLNVASLLVERSQGQAPHFNDGGRAFIMAVAAVVIMTIQGGIVLTGGLSGSFFTVLLVSTGSVAAMASERPAYAFFTVLLCWCAAAISEQIGSYEPLPGGEYPAAHFSMFTLTLAIGLLIDMGRKGRNKPRRSRTRRPSATASGNQPAG